MVPSGGHQIVGGELLEKIHIGHQPGPREQALEEVVTEEGVLRYPSREGRLKSIDVVDPFAGVGSLFEEVLIHVGGRGCVGVNTPGARDDPLVGRAFRACRQGRRNPGLQDRISPDHATFSGIEARPVQRVRRCPDQTVGTFLRQPGVCIQGEDVADPLGHRGRLPANGNEGGVPRAPEQPVQLVELPSLPLPADPLAFLLVPETPTVQQKETAPILGGTPVFLVEARDAVGQCVEELLVAGHTLLGRIRPVAQECEVKMAFRI